MCNEPVIDVHIPYEPAGQLGMAYNRAMRESAHEWVLLLDHDCIIVQPLWYDICQKAIKKLSGFKTGWISAMTNYSPSFKQVLSGCPDSQDITAHVQFAQRTYRYNQITAWEADSYPLAGFFILTNKSAWEAVGGFADGYYVDFDYSNRLKAHGFKQYLLPGLYCWHADLTLGRRPLKCIKPGRRYDKQQ